MSEQPAWLDWAKVPPQFDWVAVDKYGWPFAYVKKPRFYTKVWTSRHPTYSLRPDFGMQPQRDWITACWQRPQA